MSTKHFDSNIRNQSYSQIIIKGVSILFKSMYYSNYKTYDKASMNSKTPSLPMIIKHAM
jgi:hypothetical protein